MDLRATETIRRIRERKKASTDMAFRLWEGKGHPDASHPEDIFPYIPINLSDLPNEELVRLMVVYRGWDSFISERMVEAKMIGNQRTSEAKAVRSRVLQELTKDIRGVAERKDVLAANPDVMSAEEHAEAARYVYERFETKHKILIKDMAVLSRVVEFRRPAQEGRGATDDYPTTPGPDPYSRD